MEWLGEVPGHWEIDRLKRSTVSSKNGVWGDEAKQDANDIPCVRVADFDRQGLRVELDEPTIRNILDSERVGRILVQGDLLLEKSGGGEGQPVGCVVLYDDPLPAVCSNFVARVQTAPDMDSSFWRYVHAAAYAVRLNTRSIKQTSGIQNLDASQYFDERAGFPPLPEQTQIAAFLDRETAKIDALVAEQRRLMALLKEKRQAVISHAVTRGLNPDVPMKPSGIEWLGDMPEHWEVSQSRRMFIVRSEPALTSDRMLTASQKHGVLFQSDFVEMEGRRVVEVIMGKESLKHVEPDDFIISMRSFQGGIEWCKLRGSTSFHYVMLKPVKGVYPPFFAHLFKSVTYIQALRTTTDLIRDGQELRYSNFVQVHLPLVPLIEQTQIAAFLDSETARFDTLTIEAQRAIDLLQERRTALISAAVTGQIDVRGETVCRSPDAAFA